MLSLINVCFVPLILLEWKHGMRFRLERAKRLEASQERHEERAREKGRKLEKLANERDAKAAAERGREH
jgi:hypothetical protein